MIVFGLIIALISIVVIIIDINLQYSIVKNIEDCVCNLEIKIAELEKK